MPERAARLDTARARLVFPLDVDSVAEARRLVRLLRRDVGLFKIGKQLFTHAGPAVVRMVVRAGGRVFLDLKFHDIPRTTALAAVEAAKLGVAILNVHAGGGAAMMRAVADEVARACRREKRARPKVLAVTVLTSLAREDLRTLGVAGTVEVQVVRLARLAQESGLDGVVASPHEIAAIRKACGARFLVLTPGVRPATAAWDDQKRVMTPEQAMRAGADYVVVGKPIRDAADPRAAARAVTAEMARGLAKRREPGREHRSGSRS